MQRAARPVFPAGPSGCEPHHGCHFKTVASPYRPTHGAESTVSLSAGNVIRSHTASPFVVLHIGPPAAHQGTSAGNRLGSTPTKSDRGGGRHFRATAPQPSAAGASPCPRLPGGGRRRDRR